MWCLCTNTNYAEPTHHTHTTTNNTIRTILM